MFLIAASAWTGTTTAPTTRLGVVLDHAALEKALGDLVASPERCAAMGEAGRRRIESMFWSVVSNQYRELWSELGNAEHPPASRAFPTHGPQAHTARLFASHAGAPPQRGHGG